MPSRRTTPFTCRAGCKELDVAKYRNAGPVKCKGWFAGDSLTGGVELCKEVLNPLEGGLVVDSRPPDSLAPSPAASDAEFRTKSQ